MRKTSHVSLCFGVGLFLLALAGSARAGVLLPADPEFNPSTDNTVHSGAAIARFADGRFVVAWIKGTDGCCEGRPVAARVFEPSGVPVGPEVVIGESGYSPQLTIVPPGNQFILTTGWAFVPGTWRLFDESLVAQGPEVSTGALPAGTYLNLNGTVIDGDGNVEILCQYYSNSSPPMNRLQIQRYLLDGTPIGVPTIVEQTSTDDKGEWPLGLVATSDGNVAVAWSHFDIGNAVWPATSDPSYSTGWIRRYDPSGATVGSDFSFTGGPITAEEGQLFGMIAADGTGHIVVYGFLNQHYSDGIPPPLLLKRFALDGSGETDLPHVESTYPPRVDALAMSTDGHLVIAYGGSEAPSGSIQRYHPDGSFDGPSIPIADNLVLFGSAGALSINAAGSVLAAVDLRDFNERIGVRVRRFCDSDDAQCERCPAYDDAVDNDDDGLPDGCDPCNVLDSGQVPIVADTRVAYGGSTVPTQNFFPVKSNRMKLSQRFLLPAGSSFADLPVEAEGFRLRIESAAGAAMADISVPGGAFAGKGTSGWFRKGTKYFFLDRTSTPVNGLRRITISDLGSTELGMVGVQINAAAGAYAVRGTYPPIKSILVLGSVSSSVSGLCSETAYSPDECDYEDGNSQRIHCASR